MFKPFVFVLTTLATNCVFALSAIQLLEASDKYRSPYQHTKLQISIDEYKDRKLDKSADYEVYYRDGESLVDIRSGANQNNRVLLSDKGMYLTTKRASRPVRITPIQRLLGQASYGDLAGLRLVDDYSVQILKKQDSSVVLELTAKSKKSTYHRVLLWIDAKKYHPIKAEAYLNSGKLYKKMRYMVNDAIVKSVEYTSPDVDNKKTLMRFNKIIDKKLPKRFFTSHGMRGKIN